MIAMSTSGDAAVEGGIFIFQRWDEFFSKWSPDSFRPRLSNIATLLSEIQVFSGMANEEPAWDKHVGVLRQELSDALITRQGATLCTSFERHLLEDLSKCDSCERAHLLARALSNRSFSEEFEERLVEAARNIPTLLPKKKQEVDGLLGELATVCIQRGLSGTDFVGLPENKSDPCGYITALADTLSRREQAFVATVEVSGETSDIVAIARKVGLALSTAESVGETSHGTNGAQRCFVSKNVNAATGEQALQILIRELRTAFDLYTLYCNGEEIHLLDDGWVRVEGEARNSRVRITADRDNSLHPRKAARSFTLSSLDILNSGRMPPSILNALELHAQTFRTGDRRVRLLNTWSALECLASSALGSSIIFRVVTLTAPIVTWRRVEKIARYLAISLHHWRASGHSEAVIGLPNAKQSGVPVEDVLISLCCPKNHPRIASLLSHVAENPLLKYRIFRAWEVLHDPKRLAAELRATEKRVTWQLWRIYRARSLLVHSGIEVPMLGYLTDNLHYYFSTVLSRLLHGMSSNASWQLSDAALHWGNALGFVHAQLVKKSPSLTVADFVPTPTRETNSLLWPPAVEE